MSKQKYPQASVSTDDSGKKKSRISKVRAEYSSFHLHAKRKRKKEEAEERNAKYAALSLKEKFATLVPGGSKRQVARLTKLMEVQPLPQPPAPKPSKVKKS
jgi:hypothetical protein